MVYIPLRVVTRQTMTGERYFEWVPRELVDRKLFDTIFVTVFEIVLKFAIPFLIIVPLTVITIVLLIRQSRERRRLKQGILVGNPEYAITITLVAIVVAFIILRAPHMTMTAIFITRPATVGLDFTTLIFIASSVMILNPTCNFVIYFATGSAFRQTLRQVVICGRGERHSVEITKPFSTFADPRTSFA